MIVLDASVLIAYLDDADAHHARAEELLAREIDDDFGANSLTLAEVYVVPARNDRLDEARAVLRDLEVAELQFPPGSAVRLAKMRAETGLKMPDCCVLFAAETTAARIASFDGRLGRAATQRDIDVVA